MSDESRVNDVIHAGEAFSPPDLIAPTDPPDSCPIAWQPSPLSPVFWAFQDYSEEDGTPLPLRLFFPTLDGVVHGANLLRGCGRYPLVLFVHGHCIYDLNDHYKRWTALGRVLAKSGYIAVMPQVASVESLYSGQPQQAIGQVLDWVRNTWAGRDALMSSPATALVGHSYGGSHAVQFAAASNDITAFAALHTGWEHDASDFSYLLDELTIPKLFITGGPAADPYSPIGENLWQAIPQPAHMAQFATAGHWDYLAGEDSHPTCTGRPACPYFPGAGFDVLLMFLGKYLPPELSSHLPDRIPENLRPPTPLNLSFDQLFYAGNWLTSLDQGADESECGVRLDFKTPETRIVPYVRELTVSLAARAVRRADLRPQFTGQGTWVARQKPAGGTRVTAGTIVEMGLRDGPIP